MKNVVILAVIAVGIVGFGYFAIFATPAQEMANDAKDAAEEYASGRTEGAGMTVPREGTGTLDYLRLLNEDLECTISYEDVETKQRIEGTYFVSNGSMRGDFLTESPDLSGQVLSSMIINGATMYVWSDIDGALYGVQMDIAAASDSDVNMHEPVKLDAAVKYDCKPWPNVDQTVFTPPATAIFQDANVLLKTGMEYGTIYEEGAVTPEF